MPWALWRIIAALLLALGHAALVAAEEPAKIASATPGSALALNAIAAGALSRTNLGFAMLEGRATLSKHLYLAAGPAVLVPEGGDAEYQARVSATVVARLGRIQLDDRNLGVFTDAGTARYRNRLRLTMPLQVNQNTTLRLQVFNEAHYQQGGRGWFRNVIAAGAGLDAGQAFSADVYGMILDDDSRREASIFLLMLTAHLL
jgi:hypothetical protein